MQIQKLQIINLLLLNPNLGVAIYDDKEITLADIPGLIEGAHEGVGLGIKFFENTSKDVKFYYI